MGEKEFEIVLPEGEQLWAVVGSAGIVIDSLLFIGNQGVYGPYGGDGGDSFASERPGCYMEFISGSAGDSLDSFASERPGCYMEFISGSGGDSFASERPGCYMEF